MRKESSEKITTYADAFFSCAELKHLNASDCALVKNHIFARMEELKVSGDYPADPLETLKGIGPHLDDQDVLKFTNICVRFVNSGIEASQNGFSALLISEYDELSSPELKTKVEKHIEAWLNFAKERNYSQDRIQRLKHLAIGCSEIPF